MIPKVELARQLAYERGVTATLDKRITTLERKLWEAEDKIKEWEIWHAQSFPQDRRIGNAV
jgi:hypothetical protein